MLPVPLNSLLGRDELLGHLAQVTATDRLVTLTGPGGSGKTRLALAVAQAEQEATAVAQAEQETTAVAQVTRGSRFVDLSAVEPGDLVPAIGAALGVRDDPGRDPLDTIATELTDTLLVLDNCEHLAADCAGVVARLLATCPGLTVLATSRRPLGVDGETVIPVPPLESGPAAQLFLERAWARSGQPVPAGSRPAVAQLCAELDGLPLAIELAAARTAVLSVEEILSRVRDDLRLLRSPDPTAPQRHRTLLATVASSVVQLSEVERQFLRGLTVFAGTFDRAAAVAVGSYNSSLDALVDASLVERVGQGRFRLLRAIQRSARILIEADDTDARRAHAAYYLGVAERADPRLRPDDLAALAADWPNLRAAMAFLTTDSAIRHGDLRLATALATYCHLRGQYREGRAWLSGALARNPGAPARLRAEAGSAAALLAMLLCDYPAAAGYAEWARRDFRAAGDRRGEARVEMTLGSVARERGEYARSAAHLDVAAARYADCGDERGEAHATQLRGFTAWLARDFARAQPRLQASLHRFERLGDPEAEASALVHLAAVAHYRGDSGQATELIESASQRYAELGFPEGMAWADNVRGLIELRLGRTAQAAAYLLRSLAVHRRVGDRWRTASVLCALAEVTRRAGAARRAARLLGAAAAIREAIGVPVPDCERLDVSATLASVRAELGEAPLEAELRAGRAASLDALVTH